MAREEGDRRRYVPDLIRELMDEVFRRRDESEAEVIARLNRGEAIRGRTTPPKKREGRSAAKEVDPNDYEW